MHTHLETERVDALTIRVQSYDSLTEIEDSFPCHTRPGIGEIILDCIYLEEADKQNELRSILDLPDTVVIPEQGFLIFWK